MHLEFENTHCHTFLSNVIVKFPDSPTSLEDYAKEYVQRGHQCLIASEHGYRGDVWQQADIGAKYNLKPICAAEVYYVPDRLVEVDGTKDRRNFHLCLIAKDNVGFKQLNSVLSEAQLSGFYYHGRVDNELLRRLDASRFICTTACVGGVLGDKDGEKYASELRNIFRENFYLEVQPHLKPEQIELNKRIYDMYSSGGWKLWFGADTHYVQPEDKQLRTELLLSKGIKFQDDDWDLYLPTAEEAYNMLRQQDVFSPAQIEEAMRNTLQVREFEGFSYTTEIKLPISKSRRNDSLEKRVEDYRKLVLDGYKEKEGDISEEDLAALEAEMKVIIDNNMCDYFLSLKDILDRGQELGGVITKTARGSAGSYASCYALNFTNINRLHAPVKHVPERFISADKLKAGCPDIDTNLTNVEAFETAGKELLGQWSCVPMIAFQKAKKSQAFKLLAKARGIPFSVSNEISKQITFYEEAKKRAIEQHPDDNEYDVDEDIHIEDYVESQYLQLVDEAKQYENIVLTASEHPCAHLTYNTDLREDIGIIRMKPRPGSKEPEYVLFMDGVTADRLNYVKSDMLRVDVVKVIADTFKLAGHPMLSVNELLKAVKEDKRIFQLYGDGVTIGINQLEGAGTTAKCKQFKPKTIVEATQLVGAIRPGARSFVDKFVSRTPFSYGIKSLDELLRMPGTTGNTAQSSFILFDEQILLILMAAGFDGGHAYQVIKSINF